jgi:hypothetical protein
VSAGQYLAGAMIFSVALGLECIAAGSAVPTGNEIENLLSAYSAGRFDIVDSARPRLRTAKDVAKFREELDRAAARWPPAVVAVFALEVAHAAIEEAIQQRPSVARDRIPVDGRYLGAHVAGIVEVGCSQFRRASVSAAFMRDWNVAALTLALGPGSLVRGGLEYPIVIFAPSASPILHHHARHAREAFPNDPFVLYEWGAVHEIMAHTSRHSEGAVHYPVFTQPNARKRSPGDKSWPGGVALTEIAAAFEKARGESTLQLAAALRLGQVSVWLGNNQRALELWADVARQDKNSDLVYLAHLFRGRVLADSKSLSEAGNEFAAALRIRPDTQSAVIPLAALTYLAGQRAQAALMVDDLLLAPDPSRGDPWLWYLAPGYRDWPVRTERLRRAIQ